MSDFSSEQTTAVAAAPRIAMRGITKRYPGVTALDGVSFEVAAGELHAIVGENGAGKSTLMKVLSGVEIDYEGELLWDGTAVRFQSTREAEAAGIAIIHQELNLVEGLSSAANIFLGRELKRGGWWLDEATMQQRASEWLAELECQFDPRLPTGALRVGDQQLVEIAKALSLEARVLIMDEPTSALTDIESSRLFRVMERLRARGVTILYISHKMDEVFQLADRITVLRDGQHVRTLDRAATSPREITELMVGRALTAKDESERTPGDVVLEVRKLSLPWPGHAREWRLQGIDFTVRRGEIVGIAGLMGAGRTELLEALFGASELPPQGQVLLGDKVVRFRHPADARAAGVALVTEDRKRLGLFNELTVGQNITLCELARARRMGLVAPPLERRIAGEVVERLAVKTAGVEAAITSLSGGNQQKAILGRWLLTQPRLLLLDDPTRGVDIGAKTELYRLMDLLARDGMAMLVTSSELPELLAVSDRILVLCEGRLTAEFKRNEATEQKIMAAATCRPA